MQLIGCLHIYTNIDCISHVLVIKSLIFKSRVVLRLVFRKLKLHRTHLNYVNQPWISQLFSKCEILKTYIFTYLDLFIYIYKGDPFL